MGRIGSASRGWTLSELLCVVAVIAILSSLAVPSFAALLAQSEQRGVINDLFSDLARSRSEAIRLGKRVVMCKSDDHKACRHNGTWQSGWIVFVDTNNDAQWSEGELRLSVRGAVNERWQLTGNGSMSKYVSYHPNGRTRQVSGGFQAGTFQLCDTRGVLTGDARIVISAAGRPRIERNPGVVCN